MIIHRSMFHRYRKSVVKLLKAHAMIHGVVFTHYFIIHKIQFELIEIV